jgi:hypothetical protein
LRDETDLRVAALRSAIEDDVILALTDAVVVALHAERVQTECFRRWAA